MAIGVRHAVIARNYGGKLKLPRSSGTPIVGTRDTVPGSVLFIRDEPMAGCPPLTGSVSLCHRNRNARFVVARPLSLAYTSLSTYLSIYPPPPPPRLTYLSIYPPPLTFSLPLLAREHATIEIALQSLCIEEAEGGRSLPRQGSAKWTLQSRLY